MRREDPQDPYVPPPRYKMRSGGMVRYVIVAALLGAAAWGYMEYAQGPQTALVEPSAEEQTLADSGYDAPLPALPGAPPAAATPEASTAPQPAEPPLSEPATAPLEDPPS